MTREEFIKILEEKGYPYEIVGNKVIVSHKEDIDLSDLTSLPPGVVFENGEDVDLKSLTSIPPGVEFRNRYDVYLSSLTSLPPGVEFKNGRDVGLPSIVGGWFCFWKGNIPGIGKNRLLNKMISLGLFER